MSTNEEQAKAEGIARAQVGWLKLLADKMIARYKASDVKAPATEPSAEPPAEPPATETLPAAEPALTGFYAYEQMGCDIYDANQYDELVRGGINPESLTPLTEFTVGQRVVSGDWYFMITVVDTDTIEGNSGGLFMWGFRREDGSWGAGFGNKAAVLRAEF